MALHFYFIFILYILSMVVCMRTMFAVHKKMKEHKKENKKRYSFCDDFMVLLINFGVILFGLLSSLNTLLSGSKIHIFNSIKTNTLPNLFTTGELWLSAVLAYILCGFILNKHK